MKTHSFMARLLNENYTIIRIMSVVCGDFELIVKNCLRFHKANSSQYI